MGHGGCRTFSWHDVDEREPMKLSELKRWFKKYGKPSKHFANVHILERVSDVPAEVGRDFFIVRRDGRDLWAVFECPCEQKHRLQVNLSRQKRPCWRCAIRGGEVDVAPSIWLNYGCRSHFWIYESRIYWAKAYWPTLESKKNETQSNDHEGRN